MFNALDLPLVLLCLSLWWHFAAPVPVRCTPRPGVPSEGQDTESRLQDTIVFCVNLVNSLVTCAWTGSSPLTTESALGIPPDPPRYSRDPPRRC